jgi:hypothetical protein
MGPKSGLRKRPKGVEGVSIGRLLVPKKRSRDAFGYFPNSFSMHAGEQTFVGGAGNSNPEIRSMPPGCFR